MSLSKYDVRVLVAVIFKQEVWSVIGKALPYSAANTLRHDLRSRYPAARFDLKLR